MQKVKDWRTHHQMSQGASYRIPMRRKCFWRHLSQVNSKLEDVGLAFILPLYLIQSEAGRKADSTNQYTHSSLYIGK